MPTHKRPSVPAPSQDNLERCRALADDTRSALEEDCEQLRALRDNLAADVRQTRSMLRESLLALRLGRVSLQAHHAVDAALANLMAATTQDPGGVGSQVRCWQLGVHGRSAMRNGRRVGCNW